MAHVLDAMHGGICLALPPLRLGLTGASACAAARWMQDGYDHSYFFIASFIEEHIAFHAKHLKA